ncbi:MAG: hypothetical protein U1E89_09175 [Burkholderiaceae bacterium]
MKPRRLPLVRALPALAGALLACGLAQALAQAAANGTGAIYTCVDDKGHQLRRDRYIAECSDREQRVLNSDGSLRQILPPTYTQDERADIEARQKKRDEERAAQADAVRRDRNLKVRFPNEAAHQRAREAALAPVRQAMKASDQRLRELADERKPLVNEAEFYKGKKMPPRLKQQLDGNDATTLAQRQAMKNQEAEIARVNSLFDQELEHLRKLWAGATPGSVSLAATRTTAPTR